MSNTPVLATVLEILADAQSLMGNAWSITWDVTRPQESYVSGGRFWQGANASEPDFFSKGSRRKLMELSPALSREFQLALQRRMQVSLGMVRSGPPPLRCASNAGDWSLQGETQHSGDAEMARKERIGRIVTVLESICGAELEVLAGLQVGCLRFYKVPGNPFSAENFAEALLQALEMAIPDDQQQQVLLQVLVPSFAHVLKSALRHYSQSTTALAPDIAATGVTLVKPKLLVVDHQPINIQVLQQIFASDYQVFMATSGQQALQLCRTNPPDVVLLDIVLPGMDGYQVCAQLKADPATRDIPVIFVTALTEAEQEIHALAVGAVDFITKPVVPAVVKAHVRTHITLKQQADLLRKMAFMDGLLGVFNRRYFDQQLAIEWGRGLRSGAPLSVLMIDVDYFKRYNDTYGHLAGDNCLRRVAMATRNALRRPADVVARYGGEEFACILPETNLSDALLIAHNLDQTVRDLGIAHADSGAASVVTVSIGVCCKPQGGNGLAAELVDEADVQLYNAKHAGRAQVCGATLLPKRAAA